MITRIGSTLKRKRIWFAVPIAAVALISGLLLLIVLMQPPARDLGFMAGTMSATAIVSLCLAYLAYRAGWLVHFPSIRYSLVAGYFIAGLLVIGNVWLTARLMFASEHDLTLATVLLIFATGIAAAAGLILASSIADRLQALHRSAADIASGNLAVRVPGKGSDEISKLSDEFNKMAIQLENAAIHQTELDRTRKELTAWISHDLRTPLTSIRAMLEALADDVIDDPKEQKKYLIAAQQEVRSLSRLIEDLFEISNLDVGGLNLEFMPTDARELLSGLLERFAPVASQRDIRLEIQAPPSPVFVNIDFHRMGRALSNVVDNALRHTANGGTVSIDLQVDSNEVIVSIRDNGEGISKEDLPYVFDQFFRGEKSRNRLSGGAGLGLAITRGFVEAHHGRVSVESILHKGSVFHIHLPLHKPVLTKSK